jgi:phosphoribosyl 1,2-cyclic phosphodiesterase
VPSGPWRLGSATVEAALRPRLARYISAPLSPIEIRELPADVSFRTVPSGPWRLGSATVEAALINHRGPTLGYRIEDGGRVIAYLPDHEPGLGQDLDRDPADWISGYSLARGASLLIHDGQYTEREYEGTIGWGHATVDQAIAFARRAEVDRLALFHHDPTHDDDALDAIGAEAQACASCPVLVAREGGDVEV